MDNKAELLRIAAELKSTADRLIDCAKEDEKEEKDEEKSNEKEPKLIAAMLHKKMSKY